MEFCAVNNLTTMNTRSEKTSTPSNPEASCHSTVAYDRPCADKERAVTAVVWLLDLQECLLLVRPLYGKEKDTTLASQEEEWDLCPPGSAHSQQQRPEGRVTV